MGKKRIELDGKSQDAKIDMEQTCANEHFFFDFLFISKNWEQPLFIFQNLKADFSAFEALLSYAALLFRALCKIYIQGHRIESQLPSLNS